MTGDSCLPHFFFFVIGKANFEVFFVDEFGECQGLFAVRKDEMKLDRTRFSKIVAAGFHSSKDVAV